MVDTRGRPGRAGSGIAVSGSGRMKWLALALLCAVQFMVVLDSNVTVLMRPSPTPW